MIEQKMIKIGEVYIPIIIEDGVEYYPISYLSEKVLLRKGSIVTSNSNKKEYASYIKKFQIDYSSVGGGVQEANCINKNGLMEVFKKSRTGGLDTKQRKRQNLINELLQTKEINTEERFIGKPTDEYVSKYSLYIQDAINDVTSFDDTLRWQRCTKCDSYYPFHFNFFRENRSSPDGLNTFCRSCNPWDENRKRSFIQRADGKLSRMYTKYGDNYYHMYRKHDTIGLYDYHMLNKISNLPDILKNKKDYLLIVKHLFENNKFNKDCIYMEQLRDDFGLTSIHTYISIHEVYQLLFGDTYYTRPWEFKSLRFGEKFSVKLDYKMGREIFINYLKVSNIIIENIFDFDYVSAMKECKLYSPFGDDQLSFVVNLYEYKYAGYKFKIHGVNYYKNIENRKFDLKYLIEVDMKIEVEKIPLYLTVTTIRTYIGNSTMYNVLKKYYKNLYEWVNEIYPNKYIEADFKIGFIRNEFDSMEESQIHSVLKDYLINVIYNQRHTDNTITIDGMQPDWIVLTDNNCWLVEYFGLYSDREGYNSRTSDYVDRAKIKMEDYKKLENYKKLFIYPKDLENGHSGLINKLENIK